MELELLYEDNHIIAVNKPNGVLVHEDKTGDTSMEEICQTRECVHPVRTQVGQAGLRSFDPCQDGQRKGKDGCFI